MSHGLICGIAVFGVALICALPAAGAVESDDARKPAEKIDPTSVNAACYLCHMTFVREEISRQHFKEKVTCIKCHGLSAAHANDEDVGATKPDVLYSRRQVDGMCLECHPHHDVPARAVLARLIRRRLSPKSLAICTDCHGHHKIEQPR